MRRLVLICLLLVLPLQWPWAAVAGACCPECACATEHPAPGDGEHLLADRATDVADAPAGLDTAASGCDADCIHCHGPGAAALVGASAAPGPSAGERPHARYARHLPDPVPDHPLRPPRA